MLKLNYKLLKNKIILFSITLCIAICSILCINSLSFGSNYNNTNDIVEDITNTEIKIQIDDSPISFKTSPEIVNNTIMVPMSEFFKAMGADVIWIDSQRIVVAYQDNMHLKLLIDKNEAYQNGHKINISQNFVAKNGHILVPIEIIANTFNMNPNWDHANNTLYLNSSSDNAGLKTFDNDIYKTTTIKKLDLSFAIPYHWSKINGEFAYGFNNELTSYEFIISSDDNIIDENNTKLTTDKKNIYYSLNQLYNDKVTIIDENNYTLANSIKVEKIIFDTWKENNDASQTTESNTITPFKLLSSPPPAEDKIPTPINIDNGVLISNNNIKNHSLQNQTKIDISNTSETIKPINLNTLNANQEIKNLIKITQHNILYILNSDKRTYFVLCSKGEGEDINESETIFDNIISTVTIRNESIDPREEHYVEFEPFYQYGFNLFKQYHSNMIIDNSKLIFSGNLAPQNNLQYLKIEVSHDNENMKFNIPINNSSFDGIIYLPFGLGQHNLSVLGITPNNDKIDLMRFSVINIDRDSTRFIIPTSKIQSDDPQIKSIAQTITYKHKTDYKASYAIFYWITHNIVIAKNIEKTNQTNLNNFVFEAKENTLSNYEIFEKAKGSMEEINQFLVSMLRASEIPSRVVSGKNSREHNYFWTELNLNGTWLSADPVSNISYLENDFLAPTNSKFIPINEFRKDFSDVIIHNY